MFEVSHARKLIFAVSVLFFLLVCIPLAIRFFSRDRAEDSEEAKRYYVEVGQSLDRRDSDAQTTPVPERTEKEDYYSDLSQQLDRRAQ